MAEKFILHVEVLFATIDDLEYHFSRLNMKGLYQPMANTLSLNDFLQGCRTSEKPVYSVARQSIYSHSCRTRKRRENVGWA
jgi:hypothetical protein